ncbi:hypothetical protein KIH39_10115 [Telmatocola sphagniphila]|uniref:SGNH hydrolase-type esterase domain-containing protein n=1 Tax=Telmatocola sphagniphila TaxID=1123043 RepID=A0A8E6BAN8_9BACT|nr:GDSL-type esterase/lipase family protein [Telmatocola sphagniphila]QVL34236.1 hypothetical protein KIH39_10115 [Telmatocola sphagniphila]
MKTFLLGFCLFAFPVSPLLAAEPIPLNKEERIVLIGSTIIEREQRYGHWEAALTAQFPDKNLKFRNFGWSADTVWGESRAAFDSVDQGFKRLVEITLEWKPTTIIIDYGANESVEGQKGLPKFEAQYGKLLDALAPAKAKIILVTPLILPHFSTPKDRYAQVALYADAVKKIANQRGTYLADLRSWELERFAEYHKEGVKYPFTEEGTQFNDQGYRESAAFWQKQFAPAGSSIPQPSESLREAVAAKNELVFHRWRPENETYLFGFRKHEQGKNAKEVFEFDPLIDVAEKKIQEIKSK